MRGVSALALFVVLGGCISLRLSRDESADETGFSAPTEGGERYVVVEGGPLSSPGSLTRRWAREAKKGCDGEDYLVLSDATFTRRQDGVVKRRFHEGYVRCVVSDPDPKDLKKDGEGQPRTASHPLANP